MTITINERPIDRKKINDIDKGMVFSFSGTNFPFYLRTELGAIHLGNYKDFSSTDFDNDYIVYDAELVVTQ